MFDQDVPEVRRILNGKVILVLQEDLEHDGEKCLADCLVDQTVAAKEILRCGVEPFQWLKIFHSNVGNVGDLREHHMFQDHRHDFQNMVHELICLDDKVRKSCRQQSLEQTITI